MKKKLMLISTMLLTIFMVGTVDAKVSNKDLYKFDNNLNLNESVDGTVFYGGNSVNSAKESVINGISFIFGNNVKLNGTSEYLFLAGNNITFNGTVNNDAFIAGNMVEINSSAVLNRDANIVASNVVINSDVARNLKVGAEEIIISGTINGDVNLSAEKITILNSAVINGTLKYNDNANINIENKDNISNIKTYKVVTYTRTFMDDVRDSLFSYVSLVLVAIVFSFIFKESFKKMAKFENKDIASMIGIGFGVLMLIPIISLILLMTGIGISLALITFVLYIIALYIARIPVGYYIGKLIGKSWENNKYNAIINMIVGLLIIFILNLIPVVGGIVSFISILLGFGMIYKVVRSK